MTDTTPTAEQTAMAARVRALMGGGATPAPARNEATGPTIAEQVTAFRQEYWQEHPRATKEEIDAAAIEEQQRLYDADPGIRQARARMAEREQQAQAAALQAQAEYDQRQTAAGQAELERQKGITRAAYLSAGGTAADFEREWPALKQRRLQERALAEVHRLEAEQARRVRGLING